MTGKGTAFSRADCSSSRQTATKERRWQEQEGHGFQPCRLQWPSTERDEGAVLAERQGRGLQPCRLQQQSTERDEGATNAKADSSTTLGTE